jgi:hypothetical protein
MSTPSNTQGFGQQNGDAHTSAGAILEVAAWEFEPAQKLGGVVTNATGGFEGQIMGAISGRGRVTVVVPAGATVGAMVFGAVTTLNLYADKARQHGYTQIQAVLESTPVSIDLSSDRGVQVEYRFRAAGPFNAIGGFAVLGAYNMEATSSSGA